MIGNMDGGPAEPRGLGDAWTERDQEKRAASDAEPIGFLRKMPRRGGGMQRHQRALVSQKRR